MRTEIHKKDVNEMKRIGLIVMALLAFGVFSQNTKAQNNTWIYINSSGGVSVYWRYRQELKDQYISEMRFENRNAYKVYVSVTPSFFCTDGHEEPQSSAGFDIRPMGEQAGQWAGLFWYPCGGKNPPRSGGYRSISVKRAD